MYGVGLGNRREDVYMVGKGEWRMWCVWVSDAQAFLEVERIGGKRGYGIGVYGGV